MIEKPATFHGLTIGKAKIADVKRVLGKPVEEHDDTNGTIWMYYENIGPLPGRVVIPADKKSQLVWYVSIRRNNLTLDAAKGMLGDDYRIIWYKFDSCLGDAEASPIYEDENGSLEFIVYASKGIVIHYSRRTNLVDEIDYDSKPPGPKESKCKGKPARN